MRNLSLRELEDEYAERKKILTDLYFDENSTLFQNTKAYNQAMLQEQIAFLTKKRDLYANDSKEYYNTQKQIDDLLAKDQQAKQQETHDALLKYSEEYRAKDRTARLNAQTSLLDELHKAGLISEKEYLKAVNKLRKQYDEQSRADREESYDELRSKVEKVGSQIGTLAFNAVDAFQKLFTTIKEGGPIFDDLASASTAALSLMTAGLQQFGAYFAAERDLELAKIEQS